MLKVSAENAGEIIQSGEVLAVFFEAAQFGGAGRMEGTRSSAFTGIPIGFGTSDCRRKTAAVLYIRACAPATVNC